MTENKYDPADMVRLEGMLRADGLKLAAYRVRDPETKEFSKLQFHMTWNNTVIAVMGEEEAKLFIRFATSHLETKETPCV